MGEIKQLYVFIALATCHSTTTIFDLSMSKGEHDIFALVIIFLRVD
jgi:hypothetical protein